MSNRFGYYGKIALVIGCHSGMGAATCAIVKQLGAQVHGVDYKAPERELDSFSECDLRDVDAIDSMLDAVPSLVDAVFYCAGLFRPEAPLDVMTVNFIAMRHVVDRIDQKMRPGGSIAVISSVAGLDYLKRPELLDDLLATHGFHEAREWCKARPDIVANGYALSKEAIMAYMATRCVDLIDAGIRFNSLSPGRTDTPLIRDVEAEFGVENYRSVRLPIGRYSDPDEQGWPLAFLNSDAASYMTGSNLVVDGGLTAAITSGRLAPLSGIADADERDS